ncbi:hypothetical protein Q7P37_008258 [Cladosporium fusiforme]
MEKDDLMPIAIVGMSCRLPGNVSTPNEFWQLLARGRSAWSEIPKDRFNSAAYHHPDPEKKGTMNSRGGYFLSENLEHFEPSFFDITKKEAETMDPTQRLLLECSYEAFENAGMSKEAISGKKIGVFVGGPDCEQRISNLRDLDDVSSFEPTGNQSAFLAGRIAYFYDLRGPTFTIDTACSSSMHALHLAMQSIRNGESSEAIVGAAHLITQPDVWVSMAKMRLFSESGKTHAFDERAKSGYARGEGAGCIVLKPLDKALADNDHIRAVISHSGISHNGRTVGIVAPSTDEQEHLIRRVLSEAKIDPSEVGFVEAHGTGTKVGDPIEAAAVFKALRRDGAPDSPLYMGSAKSNIGHLENASGLISVIKAALMLEKGFVVPNADFKKANPEIPLAEWNLQVPNRQQPWPRDKKYVAVNNFGYSGSNGHAILQAVPAETDKLDFDISDNTDHITAKRLFVLSANSEDTLKTSVTNLGIFLEQHAELYQTTMPRNLSYTLCQRRSHLPWRIAVVADLCSNLAVALESPDAVAKRSPSSPPRIAFIFTGQGAQWFAMGRELLRSHLVFAESIQASAKYLQDAGASFSLLEELARSETESRVGTAHISQPLCSAVQIGLVDLLRSWGITPTAVTGHSSGEIAAAYAAGGLDHKSAVQAAYYRGQCIIALKRDHPNAKGAMLAVGVGVGDLQPIFAQLPAGMRAVAACQNSPVSTTVSGDEEAIDLVAKILSKQGIFNRKLAVDVAYHSPHMEMIAGAYNDAISSICPSKPDAPVAFFSSLRGNQIQTDELHSRYWVENLTNPVLFATALQALVGEHEPDILIEIGPHAALKGPIMQTLNIMKTTLKTMPGYLPTLVRGRDAVETCLAMVAQLFIRGYQGLQYLNINHARAEQEKPELISNLFPYPWSRRECLYESRIARQHRLKPSPRHDLIGTLADWSSDLEPTWRNILRLEEVPWLSQSSIMGRTIFPISAFVSMVIEAAGQRASTKGFGAATFGLKDLEIPNPLWLTNDMPIEMLLNLRPATSICREGDEFSITTYEQKRGWQINCRGFIQVKAAASCKTDDGLSGHQEWLSRVPCSAMKCVKKLYRDSAASGTTLPTSFASLTKVDSSQHLCANGMGYFRDTASAMPLGYESSYIVHPSIFDPLIQVMGTQARCDDTSACPLPVAVQEIRVNAHIQSGALTGCRYHVESALDPETGTYMAQLELPGYAGCAPVSCRGFKFSSMRKEAAELTKPRELCYQVHWQAVQNHHNDGGPLEQNSRQIPSVTIVTGRPRTDSLVSALSAAVTRKTGTSPEVADLSGIKHQARFFIVLLEMDSSFLASADDLQFKRMQRLLSNNTGLLWVLRGASVKPTLPESNLALGLLRTIRSELASNNATLGLDANSRLDFSGVAKLIYDAFERTIAGSPNEEEFEFAEKDGRLVVPRLQPNDEANVLLHRETSQTPPYLQPLQQRGRQLRVTNEAEGFIDKSLYLEDSPFPPALDKYEVEIEVKATLLSREDLTAALDNTSDVTIERCCSGLVTRTGQRVTEFSANDRVCMLTEGRIGTHARGMAACTIAISKDISFAKAAPIPSLIGANYHALAGVARLAEGENVLVHVQDAAGWSGITVAQDLGAKVFVVTDDDQHQHAVRKMGLIDSAYVLNSSNFHFARDAMKVTQNQGMDVILTPSSKSAALQHEKIFESIAPFGRIVTIGSSPPARHLVDMKHILARNGTFTSLNLLKLAKARPELVKKILTFAVQEYSKGNWNPAASAVTLSLSEIERGMQAIQQSTLHTIVISLEHNEQIKITHRSVLRRINSSGTHVIVGGTGGLGLSVAKWMVQQGARHIVLVSRSGGNAQRTNELIAACQDEAKIVVKMCDIASIDEVRTLIADCAKTMPPICGVINAAMVLQDMMFQDLTHEAFRSVIRAKVDGTWNIHNALESRNAKLDYFVLFSSAAGIVGSRGQAAYAAANTFLDAFAAFRVARGLPAVSLDLAAVTGVGYLAENGHREAEVAKNFGGEMVSEKEVLALLAIALAGKCPAHCLTGLKLTADGAGNLPYYASDPRFAELKARAIAAGAAAGSAAQQPISYKAAFQAALSEVDARDVATKGVQQKMSEVLSVALEDVDVMRSMSSYGLDSLSAIEVRNWITRELGAKLQILELLTAGSVQELAGLIVKRAAG